MVERFLAEAFEGNDETVTEIPPMQGVEKCPNVVNVNARGLPMLALHREDNPLPCGEEIDIGILFCARLFNLKTFMLEQKRDEAFKLKPIERSQIG